MSFLPHRDDLLVDIHLSMFILPLTGEVDLRKHKTARYRDSKRKPRVITPGLCSLKTVGTGLPSVYIVALPVGRVKPYFGEWQHGGRRS